MAHPTHTTSENTTSPRTGHAITFRPMQASDIDGIIDIDHQTWYADDGSSYSRQESTLEVTGLLKRVTWSSLAFLHTNSDDAGEFVGMITASIKGEKPLPDDIATTLADREQQARQTLERTPEGRRILHDYDADFAENEHFEAQARRELDAEAVLFFLRPKARGHQLGKRLFDSFINHLDEMNLQTYWLFTDSTCSFGFYDHRGMRRTATLQTACNYMPGVTKYIYTGFVDDDMQRYANMTGEIGQ